MGLMIHSYHVPCNNSGLSSDDVIELNMIETDKVVMTSTCLRNDINLSTVITKNLSGPNCIHQY